MSITVISNFYIDSDERFLRLKSSLDSFIDADISKWIINVRGSLAVEVGIYLTKKLKNKLYLFNKNSKYGWAHDTSEIAELIETEYVQYWVEDHICTISHKELDDVYESIIKSDIDIFNYSFFGLGAHFKEFNKLQYNTIGYVNYLKYDMISNSIRQTNCKNLYRGVETFLVSLISVFKTQFFKKLLLEKFPILPIWPKHLPFNFEKNAKATYLLPFNIGFPSIEIFASIDDDGHIPNSSLISRELYPNRVDRETMLRLRTAPQKRKFSFLRKVLKKNEFIVKVYILARRIKYFIS